MIQNRRNNTREKETIQRTPWIVTKPPLVLFIYWSKWKQHTNTEHLKVNNRKFLIKTSKWWEQTLRGKRWERDEMTKPCNLTSQKRIESWSQKTVEIHVEMKINEIFSTKCKCTACGQEPASYHDIPVCGVCVCTSKQRYDDQKTIIRTASATFN